MQEDSGGLRGLWSEREREKERERALLGRIREAESLNSYLLHLAYLETDARDVGVYGYYCTE